MALTTLYLPKSLYLIMKQRSASYFQRKKAFIGVLRPSSIKDMLKAGFYSSKNILVKRDILKVYEEITHPKKELAEKD